MYTTSLKRFVAYLVVIKLISNDTFWVLPSAIALNYFDVITNFNTGGLPDRIRPSQI